MTEWQDAVIGLVEQVKAWVPQFKRAEDGGGLREAAAANSNDLPILDMEVAGGTLVRLEPARFAFDHLPTVVNLYAYPTLRRVRLVGPFGDAWEVQSSDGVAMNYRWNQADFVRLLTELVDEGVPSRV